MFVQFGLRGYHAALRLTELRVVGAFGKMYTSVKMVKVYILFNHTKYFT